MSLRKFIRRGIGLLGFLWFVSVYAYPIPDSIAVRLQGFVSALEQFGKALPQEKVYLHFDNTGYYQGDQISVLCRDFRIQSAYSVEQDVVCGITESWR